MLSSCWVFGCRWISGFGLGAGSFCQPAQQPLARGQFSRSVAGTGASNVATVEQLTGVHIDHLAIIMFATITFIATFSHIFSIGYMGDELDETVEDHQVHTEDGHLKRRTKEMIATYVSALNQCHF